MKAEEVNCSSLRELIDDKIHDERNRDILKRRLIDGVAYCQLSFEFFLTDRQIKNIVRKGKTAMGLE